MTSSLLSISKGVAKQIFPTICRNYSIRPPVSLGGKLWRKMKGAPPGKAKTYEQHLKEKRSPDPAVVLSVNIGEDYKPITVQRAEKIACWKANRQNRELEQASRHRKLKISLDEVKEDWKSELWPIHMKMLAQHYGIFRDLFFEGYFYPTTQLKPCYDYDDEFVTPVYMGNRILPSESAAEPHVHFEGAEDKLYTLVMTNPDGHLTNNDAEYLHWFVGNIPGGDTSQGDVICDYLGPFPPRGTGFHRHVFILYEQDGPLDFKGIQRPAKCVDLTERTFQTLEFFREYQESLLPIGMAFFLSEWDDSVTDMYHDVLGMKEPEFEYIHPPYYHPPQLKYPHRQPFNRYYDRYRDRKELREEVLKQKLEMISPFAPHPKQIKYPLVAAYTKDYKPTWLEKQEEIMHRRVEQYKDLPK